MIFYIKKKEKKNYNINFFFAIIITQPILFIFLIIKVFRNLNIFFEIIIYLKYKKIEKKY